MATLPPPTKGFLTVLGFIDAAGKLTTRPGYVTDADDPTQAQRLQAANQPPVVVSQLDANQAVVGADTPIPTNEVHVHPAGEEYSAFLGKVPLATATKWLVLSWQGKEIETLALPEHPPFVALTWQPGASVDGPERITWDAKHPDGAAIESMVFYSNDGGGSFRPISLSADTGSAPVDFSLLPGGKGRIMVLTTDGGNTVAALSPVFSAPIKPAYAAVVAPPNKAKVSGRWVTLQGRGYYLEEDKPETTQLVWVSSRDGQLGSGPVVQVKLTPGIHDITLAVGQGARQGKASIVLEVV